MYVLSVYLARLGAPTSTATARFREHDLAAFGGERPGEPVRRPRHPRDEHDLLSRGIEVEIVYDVLEPALDVGLHERDEDSG